MRKKSLQKKNKIGALKFGKSGEEMQVELSVDRHERDERAGKKQVKSNVI